MFSYWQEIFLKGVNIEYSLLKGDKFSIFLVKGR